MWSVYFERQTENLKEPYFYSGNLLVEYVHFLKKFTNVRNKRYGSIIVAVEFVTFLMNRNDICYFKGTGEYTFCKRSIDLVLKSLKNSDL